MSKLVELDLTPDEKTLRQFGFIALAGFGALAAMAWFEVLLFGFGLGDARQAVSAGLAALAVVSLVQSLVFPKANWPIYVGLTLLAFPIGFVLSYVIMGTLFYLLITPIGLGMRLFGRDPMMRKLEPNLETYWVKSRSDRGKESYFRQF
ncbi:MAG: SxtJ family membrane protein [Myxococcota bacterium]|nr:SxtJ family membrane protein [Myxococcota bacterium]